MNDPDLSRNLQSMLEQAYPDGQPPDYLHDLALKPLTNGQEGRPWPIYTAEELAALPPPEWLVEDTLEAGFVLLFGPWGSAKTFVALDWACSVASGHRWFGRKVRQSPVVYVAAEGRSGIYKRIQAWETDRDAKAGDRLHVVPAAVNLLHARDVEQLVADINDRDAGLLVVDTLARSMPGGDENSAQDMGRSVAALDRIRQETDCATVAVHHSGLESGRARGSTALEGASDTIVGTDMAGETLRLFCRKQKNDAPFSDWRFGLSEVADSCVLTTRRLPVDIEAKVRDKLDDGEPRTRRQIANWVDITLDDVRGLEGKGVLVRWKDNGAEARFVLDRFEPEIPF